MVNHMPTSSSGQARNKLPYGVVTLNVHSTWIVQHIYGAIQEYARFDERPGWVEALGCRTAIIGSGPLAQWQSAGLQHKGALVGKPLVGRQLFAGTPLEPRVPKRDNPEDWAISRQPRQGEPSEAIRCPP